MMNLNHLRRKKKKVRLAHCLSVGGNILTEVLITVEFPAYSNNLQILRDCKMQLCFQSMKSMKLKQKVSFIRSHACSSIVWITPIYRRVLMLIEDYFCFITSLASQFFLKNAFYESRYCILIEERLQHDVINTRSYDFVL